MTEDELALFDLLQRENLDKASRERLKQASRELLSAIKAQLADFERFWEMEQTKTDIEVFILDRVCASVNNAALHGCRERSGGRERLRAYFAASD